MGPHGYRLTCLGASLSVPAPHSLRTVNFGPVGPMCQSGGSCVCRAVPWLAIGLHTVKLAAGACLAAVGLLLDSYIVNFGAGWPHTVPRRRSRALSRGCVSGGLRSQNGTFSLY